MTEVHAGPLNSAKRKRKKGQSPCDSLVQLLCRTYARPAACEDFEAEICQVFDRNYLDRRCCDGFQNLREELGGGRNGWQDRKRAEKARQAAASKFRIAEYS